VDGIRAGQKQGKSKAGGPGAEIIRTGSRWRRKERKKGRKEVVQM